MTTVGIVGAGQLGSMLAMSILDLGADVRFFDSDPEAPGRRFGHLTVGDYADRQQVAQFARECDVLTYEFENVSAEGLSAVTNVPILPSIDVLRTCQHRLAEKQFLAAAGLPHVRFTALGIGDDLAHVARDFGLPCILKTQTGGYDGKGQMRLHDAHSLDVGQEWVHSVPCVLEQSLELAWEASCIIAVDARDRIAFPVFENIHRDHILDFTVVPARLSRGVCDAMTAIAEAAAQKLGVNGLLTVEFFGTHKPSPGAANVDGTFVMVNELAPRPHNSGHVTRNACNLSQYDALARTLVGAPLHRPELLPGGWCMANLLGDVWLSQHRVGGALDWHQWQQHPEVASIVLYGKQEARDKRKMGHFVTHAPSSDKALSAAQMFRQLLRRPTVAESR
jgi:5-(carboxyamino)imidazole ribonucleotide synthase